MILLFLIIDGLVILNVKYFSIFDIHYEPLNWQQSSVTLRCSYNEPLQREKVIIIVFAIKAFHIHSELTFKNYLIIQLSGFYQ